MNLYFEDGTVIPGELVRKVVVRSDAVAIPHTLETEIFVGTDQTTIKRFTLGATLKTAMGDSYSIVKVKKFLEANVQASERNQYLKVTALLSNVYKIAEIRTKAVIKENSSLASIYRSCGATIKAIQGDFPAPRFYCPVGQTPTFHIAKILQEEGGIVRWKDHKLWFLRLDDIFNQDEYITGEFNSVSLIETDFLERYSVPWFFSVDAGGSIIFGSKGTARPAVFSPFKSVIRLKNLTKYLVCTKRMRADLNPRIEAGDVIRNQFGDKLAVITSVHVFKNETAEGYTDLYLGELRS